MIERLSGDYNRGYTKAILDIMDELEVAQYDLASRHIRWNYKLITSFLKLFLQHRENFQEHGKGFIRWNTQMKDLEYFERCEKG